MKYAVIAVSGTQYLIKENQVITIDSQNLEVGKSQKIDTVLLTVNDAQVKVGTPTVKDASVEYEVVKNYQGEKIDVFKFKSKSRYRRSMGFRPQLTDIKITKLNF